MAVITLSLLPVRRSGSRKGDPDDDASHSGRTIDDCGPSEVQAKKEKEVAPYGTTSSSHLS